METNQEFAMAPRNQQAGGYAGATYSDRKAGIEVAMRDAAAEIRRNVMGVDIPHVFDVAGQIDVEALSAVQAEPGQRQTWEIPARLTIGTCGGDSGGVKPHMCSFPMPRAGDAIIVSDGARCLRFNVKDIEIAERVSDGNVDDPWAQYHGSKSRYGEVQVTGCFERTHFNGPLLELDTAVMRINDGALLGLYSQQLLQQTSEVDCSKAFQDWQEQLGVWPRLTHEEIWRSAWASARSYGVSVGPGYTADEDEAEDVSEPIFLPPGVQARIGERIGRVPDKAPPEVAAEIDRLWGQRNDAPENQIESIDARMEACVLDAFGQRQDAAPMTVEQAKEVFEGTGMLDDVTDHKGMLAVIEDLQRNRQAFDEEEYPQEDHEERMTAARVLLQHVTAIEREQGWGSTVDLSGGGVKP